MSKAYWRDKSDNELIELKDEIEEYEENLEHFPTSYEHKKLTTISHTDCGNSQKSQKRLNIQMAQFKDKKKPICRMEATFRYGKPKLLEVMLSSFLNKPYDLARVEFERSNRPSPLHTIEEVPSSPDAYF